MKINTTPLPPLFHDVEIYDVPLKDLVRKIYTVAFPEMGPYSAHVETFDNSEMAKKALADGAELIETMPTVTPKKAFWEIQKKNKAGMKRALACAGLFVSKDGDGIFVLTTEKPTRSAILAAKGYGCRHEREPQYSTFAGNVKFEY